MGTGKKIGELTPAEIRRVVANKYATVAQAPQARYKFRVGSAYARDLGYPVTLIASLPAALSEAFTGVSASLIALSEVKPGETVLELGCGGGLDTVLLAQRGGPQGQGIGMDRARPMLERAHVNLRPLGCSNRALACAPAEWLPLADQSVDCVVSNCLCNPA